MTDLELLFLILALVYVWECACWLRRGSVAFLTWFGRRWRLAHPANLLGNQQGGFVLATPLPPLGSLVVGNQFPLSISSEAVLAYVAPSINPAGRPAQTAKVLSFDQVSKLTVRGKKLIINGEIFLKAGSPSFATMIAAQLLCLAKLNPSRRTAAIEEMLDSSFDFGAVKARWEQFARQARPVRLLANCLFAYLFILTPVLVWNVGFRQCWPGLLAGLLALTITTSILFRRLHLRLYPASTDERFTQFLTILLSPATAIRAVDLLSRPLLESFHPLTLSRVLCNKDQFQNFAQQLAREVRHPALPVCPVEETLAKQTEQAWRTMYKAALERFLAENGLDADELNRAPLAGDESCRSYCPRCLAQFTMREAKCHDCGGLETEPLPAPAETQNVATCKPL